MCRFLIYKGDEVLLANLITRPEHSLIHQSYQAREREEPLNGDGFGLGWYDFHHSDKPCRFTSITPAWSNQNLSRLAESIYSPVVFAHVRAATGGLAVSEANCHPFQYDRMLWMHNGFIEDFQKVKRPLQALLSDEAFHHLGGSSDSEHCFMLFLTYWLEDPKHEIAAYKKALSRMFRTLNQLTEEAGITAPSFYNIALTDGENILTTRYVNDDKGHPNTLYYAKCMQYFCEAGELKMEQVEKGHCYIISSEPLTHNRDHWHSVDNGDMIVIDKTNTLVCEKIDLSAPDH